MSENLPRLDLRAGKKHSGLVNYVEIWDGFRLEIRPWAATQFDAIGPLVKRLLGVVKKIRDQRKDKSEDLNPLDILLSLFDDEDFASYRRDIMRIVYVTLERSNQTIELQQNGHVKHFALFTEDEMNAEFEWPEISAIVRIIYEQNFVKNRSRGLEPLTTPSKEEIEKAQRDQAVTQMLAKNQTPSP